MAGTGDRPKKKEEEKKEKKRIGERKFVLKNCSKNKKQVFYFFISYFCSNFVPRNKKTNLEQKCKQMRFCSFFAPGNKKTEFGTKMQTNAFLFFFCS